MAFKNTQTRKHTLLNRYTVSALALFVALIAVSTVIIIRHSPTEAASVKSPNLTAGKTKSQFSFSGATGWWQGATNETSMALFYKPTDCFTSVEHKPGTVDSAAELQKSEASLTGQGYMVTPGSDQTLAVKTPTGNQSYELHQYTVTTPTGSSKLMGGEEFGYLQLSSGYLKIMGNCTSPSDLPSTISALNAIKFDATN